MSRKINVEQMLEFLGVEVTPEIKKILKIIKKSKEIDENKLAETMKSRVNDVRKIMYTLMSKGIVKYTKVKSEEKQWWYIYLWRLDENGLAHNYIAKKMKMLKAKEDLLGEERSNAFRCDGCGTRFTVEQALENDYFCPNCSGLLSEIKRKGNVAQLEREVKELIKDIEEMKK